MHFSLFKQRLNYQTSLSIKQLFSRRSFSITTKCDQIAIMQHDIFVLLVPMSIEELPFISVQQPLP